MKNGLINDYKELSRDQLIQFIEKQNQEILTLIAERDLKQSRQIDWDIPQLKEVIKKYLFERFDHPMKDEWIEKEWDEFLKYVQQNQSVTKELTDDEIRKWIDEDGGVFDISDSYEVAFRKHLFLKIKAFQSDLLKKEEK